MYDFFDFKGPGDEEFGDGFAGGVVADRACFDSLPFTGSDGLIDGLADGLAVEAVEAAVGGRFFEVVGFHADDEHGDGGLSFVALGHGEGAGAHFGGHAEACKIGRAKGVPGEPFVRDRYFTLVFVYVVDPEAGKKGAWDLCKQIEVET